MQRIIVEKRKDELTLETWEFYFLDGILYLDKYLLCKRESKSKRKYETLKKYDRLRERDSTIEESQVPLTDEIKNEAFNQFVSKIKILRWSER